ncbi:F-box protein [Trifolium medium]|uniref:F-box protein n=1 Tax=Trifolium medium TaxID=97028 RepID=A0A392M4I7_9FABA|nr:F-box protein [Trifolium medium]
MWKEIEATHIPYTSAIDEMPKLGLLFSGAIHWIAYRDDLPEDVIVAFDLMERKLVEMHLPEEFDSELDYSGLWVFGEFLSLWTLNYYDSNDSVQIWVMKEYKVHSSWTKTLVLSLDGNRIDAHYFSLICSTKSGDIIGTNNHGTILGKCNDKGQLLEYHSYCNNPGGSEVALYVDSLLSLPANDEQA